MQRYVPLIREFAARDEFLHDAVARRLGLHSTDEKVLRLLGEDAMTAGELADHTGLTGAAVTALVDRLEALGYVTRERDAADRRKVTIRAVRMRLRQINALYRDLHNAIDALLSRYSSTEFSIIVDYLTRTTKIFAEETRKLASADAGPKRRDGVRRIAAGARAAG